MSYSPAIRGGVRLKALLHSCVALDWLSTGAREVESTGLRGANPCAMDNSIRTAEALRIGITHRRLYGTKWSRVSQGIHTPSAPQPLALAQQCLALTKVMPRGGAFAHLTAGQLYGLWLPRLPTWLPALAVLPPDEIRPERKGMYVFRSRAALPPPWRVEGLDLVPPAVCIGQLAEDLRLIDLVIAIDSALHGGLCTQGDITDALRSRQRGLPMLRQALSMCDGRSESPWETILRLLLVSSGVSVDVQPMIYDDRGNFVARADTRIKGTRRLAEYDGAMHRERERHQADLLREKALARAGWERYGYVAKEIMDDPGRILHDAEDALGVPRCTFSLCNWLALVEESTLTFAGRLRLLRRLHRFDRRLRGRIPTPRD